MIYLYAFFICLGSVFIAFSIAAIYSLYRERKNNRTNICIWIIILILWLYAFYGFIEKIFVVV